MIFKNGSTYQNKSLVWQVLTKICAKEAKCDGCGDLICTSGNMFNLFKVFGLYLRYFKNYLVLYCILYDTLLQLQVLSIVLN